MARGSLCCQICFILLEFFFLLYGLLLPEWEGQCHWWKARKRMWTWRYAEDGVLGRPLANRECELIETSEGVNPDCKSLTNVFLLPATRTDFYRWTPICPIWTKGLLNNVFIFDGLLECYYPPPHILRTVSWPETWLRTRQLFPSLFGHQTLYQSLLSKAIPN